MPAVADLSDLFRETLKDMYYAEKKILKALPKMAKAVGRDSPLAEAFENHREETEGQVERLEKVFELIEQKPKGKKCESIDGIIAEGEDLIKEVENMATLQAGLLSGAQAVEHYEISRYGTLISWAKLLGYEEAVELLEETLEEEKKTDELLTEMAESEINQAARDAMDEGEDEEEDEDDEEEESSSQRKRRAA